MSCTAAEFDEAIMDFGKTGKYNPSHAVCYTYLESLGHLFIDKSTQDPYKKLSFAITGTNHFIDLMKKDRTLLNELDKVILQTGHRTLFKEENLIYYNCLKHKGYITVHGDMNNLPADKKYYPQVLLTMDGVKHYNSLVKEEDQIMEITLVPQIRIRKDLPQ
ncbi:MAG TPA: hypothetical protein PLA68_13115 [Panacibacter sp.]|nr:hypothetical protein [Panacibacter sp.]